MKMYRKAQNLKSEYYARDTTTFNYFDECLSIGITNLANITK